MTEFEKLALTVSAMIVVIDRLSDQMDMLQNTVQDLQDIFRGCACFGTATPTEVP